jgi:carbon-monoxide dehydrogenase small subunit
MAITLRINGTSHSVDVEPETPLLWVIRDSIGLTGTKFGCGISQCGACTVHLDGNAVKSCNVLALQAEGAHVTTIEGLVSSDGSLHPMQEAFKTHHGLQCGYCTPGMVMSAVHLLKIIELPTEEQIRDQLDGNLCRCTGYHNIIKAVKEASKIMAKQA